MTAGGCIPPERKAVLVVEGEVDVEVQRDLVRQVVLVQRQRLAREQIQVGVPHVLEAPVLVEAVWPPVLVVERKIVLKPAGDAVMGLDQDVRVGALDPVDDFQNSCRVLLDRHRNAVTVVLRPAGGSTDFVAGSRVGSFHRVVVEVEHQERDP
ncbi:hypothetical protein [Naasia aerilata]|uniref:hypothetical protein n=1 Tax=Naasia aerilata TaxID=1162966 RepID=UPI00257265E4|nr:hypothetical protein [Naasia aerilata]